MARSRAIHLSGIKLIVALFALFFILVLLSAVLLNWYYKSHASSGMPIVGKLLAGQRGGSGTTRQIFAGKH